MNIQYKIYIREPWANYIIQGRKTIETATFNLPSRFINIPLYIQNENRQIIGIIKFSGSKRYTSLQEFNRDSSRHLVIDPESKFHFNNRVRTYGWIISSVEKLETPIEGKPFRGQFRIQPA